MQTFILHENIPQCVNYLDIRRCFNQSIECKQIHLALQNKSKGWRKHPAVLQWLGYTDYLLSYGRICLQLSGYNAPILTAWYDREQPGRLHYDFPLRFHKLIPFHQGLMVRKDYHYYKNIFPSIPSTGWARYLDSEDKVFHIKFGQRIYDQV